MLRQIIYSPASPKASPDPGNESEGYGAEGHPGGLEAAIRGGPGRYLRVPLKSPGIAPEGPANRPDFGEKEDGGGDFKPGLRGQ